MSTTDEVIPLGCPLGANCPCVGDDDERVVGYEWCTEDAERVRVACDCGISGPWGNYRHEAATGWNEMPRDPDWGTFTPRDLMGSGLLFSINRQVMHPLGLALSVIADKETGRVCGFGPIQDSRDDPEGIIFGADDFADGMAKLGRYLKERGGRALLHRKDAIGFIVQGPGDVERLDAERKEP
jgi:hypothetical protein